MERLHYRIACIRTDAHHKATTDIVRKAGETIGIETLSGTNLRKNHKLAKALSDSALDGNITKIPPLKIYPPYEFEVRVFEGKSIDRYLERGAEKVDNRTVRWHSEDLCALSI